MIGLLLTLLGLALIVVGVIDLIGGGLILGIILIVVGIFLLGGTGVGGWGGGWGRGREV